MKKLHDKQQFTAQGNFSGYTAMGDRGSLSDKWMLLALQLKLTLGFPFWA
jgi:hypothetical protein